MFSEVVKERLRKVDVYRQVSASLTESSLTGALVSIIVLGCMVVLFLAEFSSYMQTVNRSDMYVNIDRASETMKINLDVTLHNYPCALVSLDSVDIVGNHELNIKSTALQQRLNSNGSPIGLHTGNFDPEAAKTQLQNNEGCRVTGHLEVNTVPGRFSLSSYSFNEHLVYITERDINKLNLSHTIHHLTFGQNSEISAFQRIFSEGQLSPLDGTNKMNSREVAMSYEYYIKVVPTEFTDEHGVTQTVNQFSATGSESQYRGGLPNVSFRYDLSPVTVRFFKEDNSAFHFFVQICAIIGGVFTAGGLVFSVISSAGRSLSKQA